MFPFKASDYWFETVAKIMVRDGNLNLLSEYWLVGLGTGFEILPKIIENLEEVTGMAHTIKCYTSYYKDLKVSVITSADGTHYAEWIVAMAYKRGIKALIGIGYCGAISENIEIGDVIIPIVAIRDEDTIRHYVDEKYPAIANYYLLKLLEESLISKNIKPFVGIIVTTSSTFTESKDWAKWLSKFRVLGVECETSVIYLLSYLCNIPVVNALVVSDSVIKGEHAVDLKQLGKIYEEVAKASLETLYKYHRTCQ